MKSATTVLADWKRSGEASSGVAVNPLDVKLGTLIRIDGVGEFVVGNAFDVESPIEEGVTERFVDYVMNQVDGPGSVRLRIPVLPVENTPILFRVVRSDHSAEVMNDADDESGPFKASDGSEWIPASDSPNGGKAIAHDLTHDGKIVLDKLETLRTVELTTWYFTPRGESQASSRRLVLVDSVDGMEEWQGNPILDTRFWVGDLYRDDDSVPFHAGQEASAEDIAKFLGSDSDPPPA